MPKGADGIDFTPSSSSDGIDFVPNPTPEPSAIEKGLRALDYDRAVTGGPALAKWLSSYTGRAVEQPGEMERAARLQGDYPSSSELLRRAGYLQDSPILRGGAGLALDVGLSPTTYAGAILPKLAARAPLLAKSLKGAFTPAKAALEAGGEKLWRSAFKSLDAEALKQGKTVLPSEVLRKNNVAAWTEGGVNTQMGGVAENLGNLRDAVIQAATDQGGKVNIEQALRHAEELSSHYKAQGTDQADALAGAIDEEIASLRGRLSARPEQVLTSREASPILSPSGDPVMKETSTVIPAQEAPTPNRANDIKSFFYKDVPSSNWAPYVNTSANTDLKKALGRGFKESVESSVDNTLGAGKGQELKDLNAQLGSLLSTRKKELGEVSKGQMRNAFTSVDGILLGEALRNLSEGAGRQGAASILGIKKLADVMKLQGPRSKLGQGAVRLGTAPGSSLIDPALRRSTWSLLNPEDSQP